MSFFLVLGDSLLVDTDNSLKTLSDMKERIADELMRDDLTTNIERAISEAIEFHQKRRYWFNETKDLTFPTVSGQGTYDYEDDTLIPFLYDLDALFVEFSGNNQELRRIMPDEWEVLTSTATTGQPYLYSYINKKIMMYPTPNAAWTVRVFGHVKISAPSDDTTTGNFWMNDAEAMVRHRAKGILWRDVIYDAEKAAMAFAAEEEAVRSADGLTDKMIRTGRLVPTIF